MMLFAAALFLAIPTCILIGHFNIPLDKGGAMQPIFFLFLILLMIGGGLVINPYSGDNRSQIHRMNHISLPASNFEKVFSKWIYTLPLYLLSTGLIMWIAFKCYFLIYGSGMSEETLDIAKIWESRMSLYFMALYTFGHSILFFFSYCFDKFAILKGALVVLSTFLVLCIIGTFFINSDYPFMGRMEEVAWNLSVFIGDSPFILLAIAPCFWIAAYYVFTQKSV